MDEWQQIEAAIVSHKRLQSAINSNMHTLIKLVAEGDLHRANGGDLARLKQALKSFNIQTYRWKR